MVNKTFIFSILTVLLTAFMASSNQMQQTATAKYGRASAFEGTWSTPDGRRIRIDDMGVYLSIREIRKNGTYGLSMNAVLSNSNSDECGTQGGWFYDDPTSDSKIRICPGRCASLITQVANNHEPKRHRSKKHKSK